MYFKINHRSPIDWDETDDTFIVILCEKVTDAGTSTYVYSNAQKQGTVSYHFTVIGHSTITKITEFDVYIETGITCFLNSMKLVGVEALETYLDANESSPLSQGPLRAILLNHIS